MQEILLDESLKIKKLDSTNQKDIWLAQELDNDKLVHYNKNNRDGYLWSIKKELIKTTSMSQDTIYGWPYAIYSNEFPVGYLSISPLFQKSMSVNLAYAILESERRKGYASKTLRSISDYLLKELSLVELLIENRNKNSIKMAVKIGFSPNQESYKEKKLTGFCIYEKY